MLKASIKNMIMAMFVLLEVSDEYVLMEIQIAMYKNITIALILQNTTQFVISILKA